MNTKEYIINRNTRHVNRYQDEIESWEKVLTDIDYIADDIESAFLSAKIFRYSKNYYVIKVSEKEYYTLDVSECNDITDIIKVINNRIDELESWKEMDESVIEFTNEKYDRFNGFIQDFMKDNDDRQYEALHFLQHYFENYI